MFILKSKRKKQTEANSRNVEMNPGGPGGYWYGYGYQQPQVTFFIATDLQCDTCWTCNITSSATVNQRQLSRFLCARVGPRKCQAPLILAPSMPTTRPQLVSQEVANGGLMWVEQQIISLINFSQFAGCSCQNWLEPSWSTARAVSEGEGGSFLPGGRRGSPSHSTGD